MLQTVGDPGNHRGTKSPLGQADDWTLTIQGDIEHLCTFSLNELKQFPLTTFNDYDVTCVSSGKIYRPRGVLATFQGISFLDLLNHVGLKPQTQTVRFLSRAPGSCGPLSQRHETALDIDHCLTENKVLLATMLDGQPLPYANGGPLRTVVRDRYFYKSLKWLDEIHITSESLEQCEGTWEMYAGYHNLARIAEEERFTPFLKIQNDLGEPEPVDDYQATWESLLSSGNLSRLVSAKLELLIPEFLNDPRWNANLVFHDNEFVAAFRGTKFHQADLRGWDLSHVNFSLSRFINTQFTNADLSHCDFEGAVLWGADLQNVNMQGAYLGGVEFCKESGASKAKVNGLNVTNAGGLDEEVSEWLQAHGAIIDRS